jgi:hypothetical protein
MPRRVSGAFTVKLIKQSTDTEVATGLGRMLLDKEFTGPLEGTSTGQMLAAGTEVKGSAAYVALERVSGTLEGKRGTFHLQHTGVMNRGEGTLNITVVPDSGTGELTGLSGTMSIEIVEGKHLYQFAYDLA